jgi:murein hydrolase activator
MITLEIKYSKVSLRYLSTPAVKELIPLRGGTKKSPVHSGLKRSCNVFYKLSIVIFLSFIGLIIIPTTYAADSIEEFDQKLKKQKKKIERVLDGIKGHSSKVESSVKKETSLLDQLETLEEQINTEGKKLIHLKQKMEIQNQLTKRKRQEMEKILVQKNTLQQHTENRLAAYYRTGEIGLVNVIFSSSSLPELLSFKESYHLMLVNDQHVIHSYKEKLKELKISQAAHEEEKRKLNESIASVEEQQRVLADTKVERQHLLKRVITEKKLYQQAIGEMKTAANSLTTTLENIEKKRSDAKQKKEQQFIKDFPLKAFKKRRPLHLRGFVGNKGTLPPPASGSVVRYFKEESKGRFGIPSISKGISIKTNPGSDIMAIYSGKVVYAGLLRGYGKLIIIDHGNNYFTLTSDVGNITKKINEPVTQGERIATSSLHSGSLNNGFNFEIRHNTEPQDPLQWLDSSSHQLSTKIHE